MKRFLPLYAASAYLFLYLPLCILGVFSFNASKLSVWRGFTFDWYRELLSDSALLDGTVNSLMVAVTATLAATLLGTLAAYAIWKRRSPWLTGSIYLSLVTPEIVTGVSLLVFFEWIFRYLHVQLGLHTVILAHISFSLAYVVIVILARLRTFDPALEEAALDLGATEWQTFCRVVVPILFPAIVSAALLCFTVSFDDYVITSMVAGIDSQTLPMVIYAMARKGVNPEVNALSMIVTVALGVFILAAGKLESHPASGKRS